VSLKKHLDAGKLVIGSAFDGKVKPLGSISLAVQKRLGYMDKNEYLTDRGFDRLTTKDDNKLNAARKLKK
jgi:hypothetical protein